MADWPELLGPAEEVAPRLLGAVISLGDVSVRLTEVEAYAGELDPGSHAARGRTPRTTVMFGPPGHLYCYLSYGMHVCANVVVGRRDEAAAVLLRGGEVIDGLSVARSRRAGVRDPLMARGPALLSRTLGLSLDHDGADLAASEIRLELAQPPLTWSSGPRVGLRLAAERPWRFWLPQEPSVSVYRRHPRAGG